MLPCTVALPSLPGRLMMHSRFLKCSAYSSSVTFVPYRSALPRRLRPLSKLALNRQSQLPAVLLCCLPGLQPLSGRAQPALQPAATAIMPPKLFLNVAASVQSLRPGSGAADDEARSAALLAPSIEIGPSGTLKLGGAFEFNPLGMKRNLAIAPLGAAAPLGEGAAGLQASYRVRSRSAFASRERGHDKGMQGWREGWKS